MDDLERRMPAATMAEWGEFLAEKNRQQAAMMDEEG